MSKAMKLLHAAICIGVGIVWSPVFAADNPTEVTRREALQFLDHCPADPADERQLCLANQAAFVWQYISAKSGNYDDQINVAYILQHGAGLGGGGVITSMVQSCAWYLVAFASGDPRMTGMQAAEAGGICNKLDESEHPVAAARAARIGQDIRMLRVRKLPGDSTDFYGLAQKRQLSENTYPLGDEPAPHGLPVGKPVGNRQPRPVAR